MKFVVIIGAILCLAVSGCISSSSVHPILTDEDLSHDIDLNGSWRQIDSNGAGSQFTLEGWDGNARYDMTLNFTQADDDARSERERKGGKVIPAEYDIAIGELDGHRFLQARRSELITGGPSFFEGVVTYAFAKFDLKDDVLLVYTINDQALENLLPKTTMAHFMHKPSDWAKNIVLTESTARVQEFLKEHHKSLFHSNPHQYRRVRAKSDDKLPAQKPATAPVSNGPSSPSPH